MSIQGGYCHLLSDQSWWSDCISPVYPPHLVVFAQRGAGCNQSAETGCGIAAPACGAATSFRSRMQAKLHMQQCGV